MVVSLANIVKQDVNRTGIHEWMEDEYGSDPYTPETFYASGYWCSFWNKGFDVEDPSLGNHPELIEAWKLGYEDGKGDQHDAH